LLFRAVRALSPVQLLKARQNAVVVKSGAAIDGAELIRYCEGRLSYFAIPRFIDFVADLPRTESGKVQKFKLREQGRSAQTWDPEAAGIKLKP